MITSVVFGDKKLITVENSPYPVLRSETTNQYLSRLVFEEEVTKLKVELFKLIDDVLSLDNWQDDDKKQYNNLIDHYSIRLAVESHNFQKEDNISYSLPPNKVYSRYHQLRIAAFAYRNEIAIYTLNKWMLTHKSAEGCVVSYKDTLNIPFQELKVPK
jgi:hypothetical protein